MLKQYFAQSLLNQGFISADEIRFLLENMEDHPAGIEVRGLWSQVLTGEQIESIKKQQNPGDDFGTLAVQAGYMTESDYRSLSELIPTTNMSFAQGLISEKMVEDYQKLEKLMCDYKTRETLTIGTAVNQVAMKHVNFEEIEEEYALYSEYTDVFLRALSRFLNTEAVINLAPEPFSGDKSMITISQRLTGDVMLITGIMAEEDVILALARRYSQEDIKEVGELAVDSVAEFLNVTNGLYIVNLSNRHLNVDLDPYRSADNVLPAGNRQLVIRIDTVCGSFDLILATDEIIF